MTYHGLLSAGPVHHQGSSHPLPSLTSTTAAPTHTAARATMEVSDPNDLLGQALSSLTTPLGNSSLTQCAHFVHDDAPLGSSVSSDLRNKIKRNEYIVLDCLLPHLNTSALSFSAFSTNGQLDKIMVSNQKTKIKDFGTWLEAFAIYASILVSVHPNETLGVLKHLDTVQRLYKQRANWLGYDIEFRKIRSVYNVPFIRYIHSKYDKAKDPLSLQSLPCPASLSSPKAPAKLSLPKRYCFKYNGPQYCNLDNNCTYVHRCLVCDGQHPWVKCPLAKRTNADKPQ